MDQKQLYPVCGFGAGAVALNTTTTTTTGSCFDLETMVLVQCTTNETTNNSMRGRALRPRASPYARVRDWRKR